MIGSQHKMPTTQCQTACDEQSGCGCIDVTDDEGCELFTDEGTLIDAPGSTFCHRAPSPQPGLEVETFVSSFQTAFTKCPAVTLAKPPVPL